MKSHVSQDELCEIAGIKQKSLLIQWLLKNRIGYRFTHGGELKGQVWTTQKQIDDSFGEAKNEVGSFGTQ